MNGLIIRPFRPADAIPLATLCHRSVNVGAALRYDAEQRAAWSPTPPTGEGWRARVEEAETIVAEHHRTLLGFMTVDLGSGFLDFAYVAPEVMGQGVAAALYAVIEGRARVKCHTVLETEASLLAEPFFRRQGWRVLKRQMVERHGVNIPNVQMEKRLVRRFAAA